MARKRDVVVRIPTRREAERSRSTLVAGIVVLGLVLNGLSEVVHGFPMMGIWLAAAVVSWFVTIRIERHKARRPGLDQP